MTEGQAGRLSYVGVTIELACSGDLLSGPISVVEEAWYRYRSYAGILSGLTKTTEHPRRACGKSLRVYEKEN